MHLKSIRFEIYKQIAQANIHRANTPKHGQYRRARIGVTEAANFWSGSTPRALQYPNAQCRIPKMAKQVSSNHYKRFI